MKKNPPCRVIAEVYTVSSKPHCPPSALIRSPTHTLIVQGLRLRFARPPGAAPDRAAQGSSMRYSVLTLARLLERDSCFCGRGRREAKEDVATLRQANTPHQSTACIVLESVRTDQTYTKSGEENKPAHAHPTPWPIPWPQTELRHIPRIHRFAMPAAKPIGTVRVPPPNRLMADRDIMRHLDAIGRDHGLLAGVTGAQLTEGVAVGGGAAAEAVVVVVVVARGAAVGGELAARGRGGGGEDRPREEAVVGGAVVLRQAGGGEPEERPQWGDGGGDQDDPHFGHAPYHEGCDFVCWEGGKAG